MKVLFLHPDLGIGGAERLIIDAAIALKNKHHDVKIVTAQYDESHAFSETKELDVRVIKLFPRHILGRFFALCAYIRMIFAAIAICLKMDFDVVVCDQVSACLLVFKLFSSARRIFYCHYPDMLLTERKTYLKSMYRFLLDSFEEWTTGMADIICVNSQYTAGVVRSTFKSLKDHKLEVVYPSLNMKYFDEIETRTVEEIPEDAKFVFMSLNRYEVKKNVALAVKAYAHLRHILSATEFDHTCLVIAGGYDKLNQENVTYYRELVDLALANDIPSRHIVFLKSPSDREKAYLLKRATAVLYTPHNEHFGIVPIESMYLGKPVIAVNSGGPMETIDDGKTGFLLEQAPQQFAEAMKTILQREDLRLLAAKEGPKRVQRLFAFEAFATQFDRIIRGLPVD
ncbi:unnamed protein product, partial [Mesorhabditis belari]|uniref:Alpha-1,3/1,6-mannosyltransferase ALG2 n=1 Tax=Mesorhabditis belari TaxID=2138241 RepID=A0AAF3EQ51_9BILA